MKVDTKSKVGMVLYIVAYVSIALIYSASIQNMRVIPGKERRVPLFVLLALPFIFVRLAYSTCEVFTHSHWFNPVAGNVVILIVMAILEEFVVVMLYIILGFLVNELDASTQGPITRRQRNSRKGKTNAYHVRNNDYPRVRREERDTVGQIHGVV